MEPRPPPPSLDLVEASRQADASPETVRRWCTQLGIGRHDGRAWRIDPAKLQAVIDARRVLGRAAA
jgi:hypothetical protein